MNYETTAVITASIESAVINIKALRFSYLHGLLADSFETLPFYIDLLRGFLKKYAGRVVWLKGGIIEQPAYLVFKTELSDAVVEMLSKPLENQGIYQIETVQNPLELIRKYVDNERMCIGLLETARLHLGNRQTLATSMPFDYQEGILLDKEYFAARRRHNRQACQALQSWHSKYRGVGLAEKLVRDTLPLVDAKLVETVAAMAKYNPFFERAGMRLLGTLNVNKDQLELKARITELGGNPDLMYSSREAKRFYNSLTPEQKQELTEHVFKIAGHRFASQTSYSKTHLMQILRAGTEEGAAALLKLVLLTEKYYLA